MSALFCDDDHCELDVWHGKQQTAKLSTASSSGSHVSFQDNVIGSGMELK